MLGSRALYHDGWKSVVFHPTPFIAYDGTDVSKPFDEDIWELYHVAEDFSEVDDLAEKEPEQLEKMKELWWEEAAKYQVLPLNNEPGRFADRRYRRERYELYPGIGPLPEAIAPNLRNRGVRDRRRPRRARRRAPSTAPSSPTAATPAATPCTSRTGASTSPTTSSAPRSPSCRPSVELPVGAVEAQVVVTATASRHVATWRSSTATSPWARAPSPRTHADHLRDDRLRGRLPARRLDLPGARRAGPRSRRACSQGRDRARGPPRSATAPRSSARTSPPSRRDGSGLAHERSLRRLPDAHLRPARRRRAADHARRARPQRGRARGPRRSSPTCGAPSTATRDARVALLRGAGKGFSAGGSFELIDSVINDAEARLRTMREARDLVVNLIDCSTRRSCRRCTARRSAPGWWRRCWPTCRSSGRTARIIDGHTRLGVAAGDHAAICWPLLCGMAKAKYLLLTCDTAHRRGGRAHRAGVAVRRRRPGAGPGPRGGRAAGGGPAARASASRSTRSTTGTAPSSPAFDASLAYEFLGFGLRRRRRGPRRATRRSGRPRFNGPV